MIFTLYTEIEGDEEFVFKLFLVFFHLGTIFVTKAHRRFCKLEIKSFAIELFHFLMSDSWSEINKEYHLTWP